MAQSSGLAFRLVSAGFDTSRIRLLRLHEGNIGLLFQPVNSPSVIHFQTGNLAPRRFIAFSRRVPRPVDLVVDVNSQDATQAFCRTNASRKRRPPIIVHFVPTARGLSQNEHTRIHRMLIETELFSEEFLKSPPPLLRLVSQAVPTSDFEELIRVHAVLDVRFRHGHVEGSFWPFLTVGQQKIACTSPIVNTKRQEAINFRTSARRFADNVGSLFCDLAPGPERQSL